MGVKWQLVIDRLLSAIIGQLVYNTIIQDKCDALARCGLQTLAKLVLVGDILIFQFLFVNPPGCDAVLYCHPTTDEPSFSLQALLGCAPQSRNFEIEDAGHPYRT